MAARPATPFHQPGRRRSRLDNPHLTGPDGPDVAYFWHNPYKNLYIPATYTLWSIVARNGHSSSSKSGAPPFDPAAFHVTNVACTPSTAARSSADRLLLTRGRWSEKIPEVAVTAGALLWRGLAFAAHR